MNRKKVLVEAVNSVEKDLFYIRLSKDTVSVQLKMTLTERILHEYTAVSYSTR